MRSTPQSQAVIALLKERGHATNLDIFNTLKTSMSSLTLSSVHRITSRLVGEEVISTTPHPSGVVMLDSNTEPHDHFFCISCGGIIDIYLDGTVVNIIQRQIGQNIVRKGLLVSGTCQACQQGSSL